MTKGTPRGVVDRIEDSIIYGWAIDPEADGATIVDCIANGEKVGSTFADRFRTDLKGTESASGHAGFEFKLPVQPGLSRIEVRHRRTKDLLTKGRQIVGQTSEIHGMARWLTRDGLLNIDTMGIADGEIVMTGWCIVPAGGDTMEIIIDGAPVAATMAVDGYLSLRFALPVGVEAHRFTLAFPLIEGRGAIEIGLGMNGRSINNLRNIYCPMWMPILPDPERQKRVQGEASDFLFGTLGYTMARQIFSIMKRHGYSSDGAVLDWGSGCARVAQFMPKLGLSTLHGCDIDHDNVDWCIHNIKDVEFRKISPDSPTDYDDDFFSCIYGISVFTHLSAEYETFWLKELRRITTPGGLVMVSTLGGLAAMRAGQLHLLCEEKPSNKPIDANRNPDLDGVIKDKDYYRNVFHTHHHVYSNWGRLFQVEHIYEGIVGNNQDLVVLRRT